MKNKNNCIMIFIVACILMICLSGSALATENENEFTYDHLWAIVGMQIMSDCECETTIWNENSYISNVIPLHNHNDEVTAYYAKIEPAGYMIVNADVNNPDVLEFSYSDVNYTDINLEYISGQKIYYNGADSLLIKNGEYYYPVGISDETKIKESAYIQNSTFLNTTVNSAKAQSLNNEKATNLKIWMDYIKENKIETFKPMSVSGSVSVLSASGYGIIDSGDLPTSSYSSGILYGCSTSNIDYVVTGDFDDDYVSNHCSSTSATNMLAYYSWYYSDSSLLVNGSTNHTFYELYEDYLGSGPVWVDEYQEGLTDYLYYNTQYGVNFGTIKSWTSLKSHLAYYNNGDNHMLYLLIWNGLEAHYVNGVGYREYTSGSNYVRIIDNWNVSIDKYISYSSLGSASEVGYCDIYSLYDK